uniref:RING-type domain-containing protein n=1 Tax=Ascaris lumbricoides TaxID=6252 RepID=A0A0M3HF44_ASCLU
MCSWFYCLIFSIHFTLLFYILKLRHTLGEPYDDFGYVLRLFLSMFGLCSVEDHSESASVASSSTTEKYDKFRFIFRCIVCECISKDQYMCTRCGQLCGCEKCVGEMLSSSTRASCPLCRQPWYNGSYNAGFALARFLRGLYTAVEEENPQYLIDSPLASLNAS